MHYSALDRAAGYAAVMLDAGLQPQVLSHERYIEQHEHIDACRALLSGPNRPTAVIAYSEPQVLSLLVAARSLELEIPRDLSIVVFAPIGTFMGGYDLSLAAVPTSEMGHRAVRMLLRKLAAPAVPCAPEPIPFGIAAGSSVVAPPSAIG
jgi:LacI family transcriptional regulator